MTSLIPRADIYDPKTLVVMDQAFTAIWNVLRADDLFREYATHSELVAEGVTDPVRLRNLTVESLLVSHH